MFETEYAEGAGAAEALDRYRDVPLGVEAAWPGPVSDEIEMKPGGNPQQA